MATMTTESSKRQGSFPGGAFKDKEKPTEVRLSNITAAKGTKFKLIL